MVSQRDMSYRLSFGYDDWLEDESNKSKQEVELNDVEFDRKTLSPSETEIHKSYEKSPGRTNQERSFISKLMEKYPKESLEPVLDTMPCANDKIPRFDIINSAGVSHCRIQKSITKKATELASELKDRYMEDCEEAKIARTQYCEMMQASRESELIKMDEILLGRLEDASALTKELQKKMIDTLIEYSAHERLRHVLIMNGVVVIPKPKKSIFELLIPSEMTSNAHLLFSKMVTDRISHLLVNTGCFSEEDEFSFSLKENKVPFVIVKASSRPMYFPKHFFKENFLTHQDEILRIVRERPDDPADSYKALALIHLGTDKIPPGKLVSDRRKFNQENALHSLFAHRVVESISIFIEQLENETHRTPEILDRLAKHREILKSQTETIRHFEEEVKRLSRFPDLKPIADQNQMKVQIIHPQQHCFLCLTSNHTSRDCKVKGCNICYGKNHSPGKCKFKCPCKKSTSHGIGECTPKLVDIDHKRRTLLLEARIKNTERNRAHCTW